MREVAAEWLLNAIERSPELSSPMLIYAIRGRNPPGLDMNQLLVDHGRVLLGVDCIRHRQAINDVLAKAKERRLVIDEAFAQNSTN